MTNWKQSSLCGWGRLNYADTLACKISDVEQARSSLQQTKTGSLIAYGCGRSYGDVALNTGGKTIITSDFSSHTELDTQTGVLICDPGITFHDLLQRYLPEGFFVPVTPGTAYVTIGGAVANDVHGKNHDMAGSFGNHVLWMDLLLPSGEITRISDTATPELFAATMGGLGLTGVILKIAFKMQQVPGNSVVVKEEKITDLAHFFESFKRVRSTATYSVGWIDALAKGRHLGRGIFETAQLSNHHLEDKVSKKLRIPFEFPGFALNSVSIRMFNEFYYRRVPMAGRERLLLLEKFLYPLDTILEWNRIYGRRGFYQFQCVIPDSNAYDGIRELLELISDSGTGSFLAVLKTLGNEGSGYLSFPMSGYTLALDFPNKKDTTNLLNKLESITLKHNGRIYLAKDACLSAEGFALMYPKLSQYQDVLKSIDPSEKMNSDLARRLRIHSGGQ